MSPADFLNTICLGDRACKAVLIDSWERRVEVVVTTISRIRSEDGGWHFYNDENITDGRIVLTEAESCSIVPPLLPNDLINWVTVSPVPGTSDRWEFVFSMTSTPEATRAGNDGAEVVLRVIAADIHLEDPSRPGVEIRD